MTLGLATGRTIPTQVFFKELERADSMDLMGTVEELDLGAIGNF